MPRGPSALPFCRFLRPANRQQAHAKLPSDPFPPSSLKCGVAVVELATGKIAGLLEFDEGIEKIFDVRVNPFARSPLFSGPEARIDGTPPIWVIPPARI